MQWSSPLVIEAGVFGALLVLILGVAFVVPQLPSIRHILLGVQVSPLVVSQVRLLISAFGGLALTWLVSQVTRLQGTAWAAVAVPLMGLIQAGWGLLDQSLKGAMNSANPPPIAGGMTVAEAGGVDLPPAP